MAKVLGPMAKSALAGARSGPPVFFLNAIFDRKNTGGPDLAPASALLATGLAPYTMPQDQYGNTILDSFMVIEDFCFLVFVDMME